ncbi:hypothetical protein [Methylobacterium radiotolerans]|nr:hypothetical protein [Methylobacterium radiotolerans]
MHPAPIRRTPPAPANLGTVVAAPAVTRELRAKLPPPRAVVLAEA